MMDERQAASFELGVLTARLVDQVERLEQAAEAVARRHRDAQRLFIVGLCLLFVGTALTVVGLVGSR